MDTTCAEIDTVPLSVGRNNVVPIGDHPRWFPAGSEAVHATLGWVYIDERVGNERRVRWYEYRVATEEELAGCVDDQGDPILSETEYFAHDVWVTVAELRDTRGTRRPAHWQTLHDLCALRIRPRRSGVAPSRRSAPTSRGVGRQ